MTKHNSPLPSSEPQNLPKANSSPGGKKLLDQYREVLRNRHYSLRTEQTYISWVRQYILYHQKRHPREMSVPEINDFITHLVNKKNVSASTHTAPVVGAGGIRRSAQSSSFTAAYSISSWTKQPSFPSDLANPNAFPLSSHGKRQKRLSLKWMASTNS